MGQESKDLTTMMIVNRMARILSDEGFEIKGYSITGTRYPGIIFGYKFKLFDLNGAIILVDKLERDSADLLARAVGELNLDVLVVLTNEEYVAELRRRLQGERGVKVVSLAEAVSRIELQEAQEYYLRPRITKDKLQEIINRHKGIILKKGEYKGSALLYIPLYNLEVMAHEHGDLSSIMTAERLWLTFDGITGSLIGVSDKGSLIVIEQWMDLGILDKEAIMLYRYIVEEGIVTRAQLEAKFRGISIDELISLLIDYNLVDEIEHNVYAARKPPIKGYRSPIEEYFDAMDEGKPEDGVILPVLIDLYLLEHLIEGLCRIEGRAILYYPVYIIIYVKTRNDRPVATEVLIDGITGDRLYEIEDLLAKIRDLKIFDKILEKYF